MSVLKLIPQQNPSLDTTFDLSSHRNLILIDASTKVILQGRLRDLNHLIHDEDGLVMPENFRILIGHVLSEIETWLDRGGTMEFKAQATLSNMAYDGPANQFSCKDDRCWLPSYLSILRSATSNVALSDEKQRILSNLLRESEGFINEFEFENAVTNKAHQDELQLLHIICDSDIALHSIETAIQALDNGQRGEGYSESNDQGANLEGVIAMQRKAVAFTRLNSPDRPRQLNILANSYLHRFGRSGEVKDINLAIERQREAVASTPLDSANLPQFLSLLGNTHTRRFMQFGDVKDVESAIERQLEALASIPLNSVHRSGILNNLAISYRSRFKRFREIKDIDSAIERQLEVLASPFDRAYLPGYLNNLGISYQIRFERFGEVTDIDLAIEQQIEAAASTFDSAQRASFLNNLGMSYQSRFERFGEVKDIELAIKHQLEAVATTSNIADRAGRLNRLGNSYTSRFQQFGEEKDIGSAIEQHLQAVASTPPNSVERPERLKDLAISYRSRFERFGAAKDIDLAIEQQLKALAFPALDSVRRAGFLDNLAILHTRRFERLGEVKDIDFAIKELLEAVASTPPDGADLPRFLNNLGNSHLFRFQRFREVKDIDLAIKRHLEAVNSTPHDDTDRPENLNNLAVSYRHRFEQFGEVEDIDFAVEHQLKALNSTPLNSARRPGLLNDLAMSHTRRFERFGEVKDIDLVIKQLLEAVALDASTSPDSAHRPRFLNSLGNSYTLRFQRFREVKDIDLAIERHLEAVDSTPSNSMHRSALLTNLGNSYHSRFDQLREVKDIDSAIEQHLKAAAFADSKHRMALLNNLGNSYQIRFEQFKKVGDIDSAIEKQLETVASTPLDSANRSEYLNNLGNSYQLRFEQSGQPTDIDLAIEQLSKAVDSTPLDSVGRPQFLYHLGDAYQTRFKSLKAVTDLYQSISKFRLSAFSKIGSPSSRIMGSLQWARLTHHLNELGSASEAYDQAIHLLPQVAWIGLSAVAQLKNLNSDIQTVGCNAAACMIALAQGSFSEQLYLGRAIELLDQGRSILWSQTSNFKQDLEDLKKDPDHSKLAYELDLTGKALGQGCFHSSNETLSETDAQLYRRSAEKWEELVGRIHMIPGFHHFLLPSPISTLRTAAVNGPLVIINTSEYRCDAIIIPPKGDLVLVPLPDDTAEKLNILTSQQEKFASSRIGTPLNDDDDDTSDEACLTLEGVLNQTWLLVGELIVQKFKELKLLKLERSPTCHVWWCLTGSLSFLPIHACFPPTKPDKGMMDIVVSSYTPTISALLRAQRHRKLPTFQMLAVGQSEALGLTPLPGVTKEIAFISTKLGPHAQTLQECKATVDTVAASLPTCSWVHFACHGVQDRNNPMDSGLVLWNGHRLTLACLAQSSLASAEFAFLSCCQSATGSKQFPNEAIHLAAGLQFIGFRGVIGTMWSVGDDDALKVAMQVYGELFKESTAKASPSKAALALHQAVCDLRNHVPLVCWVPFVHFGL